MTDIPQNQPFQGRIAQPTFFERAIIRVGRTILPANMAGSIRITLPSGAVVNVEGKHPGVSAGLMINSWALLRRALQAGSIGFAESYIRGEVESDDLVRLFRFFASNRRNLLAAGGRLFSSRLTDRIRHLRRANTRSGSRQNIAAHYDLNNTFFSRWLDRSMTYSSALYQDPDSSLEAAQLNKYERIIAALDLPASANVLEIGCGWGGFAARLLAGNTHRYTGITLSREQLAYARARPELSGRTTKTDFVYQDYRDVDGQYDAIVSIEMIEAVGQENWPQYFSVLHDRLKPGGTAVIQSIVIEPQAFERYRQRVDFIQHYIFPGGMLPTSNAIETCADQAGLQASCIASFGQDYARTLATWRERFESSWSEIEGLGFDNRFRRMWRYYLTYCEGGFSEGLIDVQIYRFTRPD